MFIDGEVVADAGYAVVHRRAAELFVVALLARRHLHERGAAQEHLRLLIDEHRVVAHPRHVRAAAVELPKTSAIVGMAIAESSVMSRKI